MTVRWFIHTSDDRYHIDPPTLEHVLTIHMDDKTMVKGYPDLELLADTRIDQVCSSADTSGHAKEGE